MIKRLVLAAACAAALAVPLHAAPRPKTPRPTITVLAGTADSVFVRIAYGPVTDAKGNPIARYLTQVRVSGSGTILAADSTTFLADTLRIARPAVGDSLLIVAAVAARDTRGTLGFYGLSAPFVAKGKPWTPPPAPPVTGDTVAILDSLQVFALSARPDSAGYYTLKVGETLQLCALEYFHGSGNPVVDPVCAGLGAVPSQEIMREASTNRGLRVVNGVGNTVGFARFAAYVTRGGITVAMDGFQLDPLRL